MKTEAEEKVFTNWIVKELIGKGAFGRVYRIEREEFGTVYQAAMKRIVIPQSQEDVEDALNEGMDDKSVTSYFQSFVEEIVNEFKLMSQLKGHTNIVSYEDHMVIPHEDGIGWDILIRMELLKSLKSVTAEKNMTEAEVIKLGIDMCNALEICGKMNIIHRDIKPENMFVTSFGEYKLGDFGIARTAEKTMSNLSKKGTYTYMAPEVYKGEEYNATADIYSLGLVMYRFMNYNRAPFLPPYPQPISFSDREASLTKRISDAPMLAPACGSKELKRIILKACAYRESARYQSPAEMRKELQKLVQDMTETKALETSSLPMPVEDETISMQEEDATVTMMEKDAPVKTDMTVERVSGEEEEDETVSIFGTQTVSEPKTENVPKSEENMVLFAEPQPQYQPETEKPGKKKKGLFIGIGVAVLAFVIVVIIAIVRDGGSIMVDQDWIDEHPELWARQDSDTDEIVISSNAYLYGHYYIGGLGVPDWDSDKTFFEDMGTIAIDERDMAVIPAEMYCFPEGSVYDTPLLKGLLDEIEPEKGAGYASKTYINNDIGEDIFKAIACQLFGYEIIPQIHNFYVENIEGQRDTAELVFVNELQNRESKIGYYKINGSVMDFSYLDLDEAGRLTLCSVPYEVAFSGKNLNISSGGITRTMEPYSTTFDSPEEIAICGYVNSQEDAYEGISYLSVSFSGESKNQVSIYFTDGWRADDVEAEIGEGNTMTLNWKQQVKLGDSSEKRDSEGTITVSYLDCGNLGLVLHVDGKDYFYQKTEIEYYAGLVGDSVIEAELDEETLQIMEMTQMEMLEALKAAFEAEGCNVGEDVAVNEKTGKITLNHDVMFDADSVELSEGGKDYLARIFSALNQGIFENDYEEYLDEIIMEVHTDSSGNYEENRILSERRAEAVDDYCYEIYPRISDYIDSEGRSSDELIYDENRNEDRGASRRVILWITLDAEVFADDLEDAVKLP